MTYEEYLETEAKIEELYHMIQVASTAFKTTELAQEVAKLYFEKQATEKEHPEYLI